MFREGRVFDAANIDAVIGDFTLVNIIEPVDKVGYRRFAGTGGADKRDLLSALCIEGNIIQNVHLAVIAEGNIVQFNHARKRNFSHGIVCSRLGSVGNAPDFFAVCVQAEGNIAVIDFGWNIHKLKHALRARKRKQNEIELLRNLRYALRKLPYVLQKAISTLPEVTRPRTPRVVVIE